jgi:hypothetical protein
LISSCRVAARRRSEPGEVVGLDFLILFGFDQLLAQFQRGQLGRQILGGEIRVGVDPFADQRQQRPFLGQFRRRSRPFGPAFRQFAVQGGQLGLMFGQLAAHQVAVQGGQPGVCSLGQREIDFPGRRSGFGVVYGGAQTRGLDVQFQGFARQPVALGAAFRRVHFDQHVAGPDRLAFGDMDRADHAQFHRLDQLGALVRHDPPFGDRDHIDMAEPRPGCGDAEKGAHRQCRDPACR